MSIRYYEAIEFAKFNRRMAHSTLRRERLFHPEWKNEDTYLKQDAKYNLRVAIRYIQIAKLERDRHVH